MDLFGSSGIRGVANETLTPAFAMRVAASAGTVWTADRAAIARDTRTTGPMLVAAAASGLASTGTTVEELGVVPTPGVQAYAEAVGYPAIVITASHNPPEYNGIKLIGADGAELAVADLERIESVFLDETTAPVAWDAVGEIESVEGVNRQYREEVLGAVDRERIAAAELVVAVDPGHGAGAITSPRFFRDLGCDVVTVNAQPDGHFPGRNPEPVPAELEDLCRLVEAADADIGIAHDGDADRAIFVDESGACIQGDTALAALAAGSLEAGDVTVSAVNVSQRLVDAATSVDARVELTPIGSTHLMTRIRELEEAGERVPIAGEGNGGIIFPDYRLARDGMYTAARFLELLAEQPASAVVEPFDGYHNVRINLSYESDAERERMVDAIERFAADADAEVTTIDGYRLDYGDAWVLARESGTEPLIRIYAESREPARAEELAEQMKTAVTDPVVDA